ncbi:hypothetical protein IQ37_12875 [Chryseobacterium piperi]|uniref:DUF962 domain-containing protein n=1 Tax=Chryseobacterium piperi TaxID=558152 RepID=A0A086B7T8_9FLAO|nr:Mpo1-like protein [Chryseobacterium piperi]ASW74091.1 DUF962 domain-containing protein [Chryseobacterium piperi]KFF25002.1 hypothetical protein IQ37_12875 [Chryseobacterium piperi]
MRKIDLFFAEYRGSHKNRINKLIHLICVPLVFWSILGFISLIPSSHFCASYFGCISIVSCATIILVTLFYLRLSLLISLIMLVIMLLMEHLTYTVNVQFGKNSWIFYTVVFMITCLLQLVGHQIEGKKPSFPKDLKFLLIGPIWLVRFVLKKAGIKY